MGETRIGGAPPPAKAAAATGTGRIFLVVAALVGLYVLLDAVAQLLPPHYSPIAQAESDLAVGPFGYLMTLNFVNRGILSLLFLLALVRTSRAAGTSGRRHVGGAVLMGIWGVGALLLAIFPTDVPPTPVTLHGLIHLVVAVLAFLGGAFGSLLISIRLGEDEVLRGARSFALPIALLAVLSCLVVLALPSAAPRLSGQIGGLTERTFLGLVLLWILAVSIYAWRRYQPGRRA